MNNQLSKLKSVKKEEGFTIIEVMIVLAIAGLILLIVFLAVPALQRNAKNTAIKNDATGLTSAFNEYKSNNDGALPLTVTAATGTITLAPAVGSPLAPANAKVQTNTTVAAGTVGTAYAPAVGTLNQLTYILNAQCGASGSLTPTAQSGQTAVYYTVQTGTNTYAGKCIEV